MAFHRFLLAAAVCLPAGLFAQTSADLFDDSALHEIRITMAPSDFQLLKDHVLDNTYYNVSNFQWKGVGGNAAGITNLALRSRGRGSRTPIKPGFHVDFNHNNPSQTFLGLTEVDLKPNSQDPSMLHEKLSMTMFIRMGVPASREAYTRIYVNDVYQGVYIIVETPDSAMLRRLFNENNGFLYEFRPGDWSNPSVNGSGYHFEYLGSDLDKYSSPTIFTPFDPQVPHQNAPDPVTLEEFIRTINQAPDSTFLSDLGVFMDPKAFLTLIAVETYLADFDCILGDIFGMNNFFLYRYQSKKFNSFIAWDKDNAFAWTERPILQNADKNVLMRRLLAIPELKTFYFDALAKTTMLAGGSGGFLQQEADRLYNQIHQAALEDQNKTYLDAGLILRSSDARFEAAVVDVHNFGRDRTAFVTKDLVTQGYAPGGSYPSIADGGIVNAAAFASPPAGGYATLFGGNFGDVKNTTAYVNGYSAYVSFSSPGQMNIQVPWEAAGFASFGVVVNGQPSNIQFSNVQPYSPGIFVVTHSDGFSLITDSNPARVGETVVVYANGLGPVDGPMISGQPASSTSLQPTKTRPTVSMNSIPATVVFSGLLPGFIGCYQVNATVPAGATGTVFLDLAIAGTTAPAAQFPVR